MALTRFLFVLFFCFSSSLALAATSLSSAQKFTLDNGLTVLVTEMPSSPVASLYVWVKTGAANEGRYLGSGISHFLEHMFFKGTKRRGPGVISDDVRAAGGAINASTGQDHTEFHISLPRENIAVGVDVLADMMTAPLLDLAEMEKERDVIIKEMRMIKDKPDRRLDEIQDATVYHVHPYRLPIIGREMLLKALTRTDLEEYYRAFYVPNNMIVSVAGGVKAGEVLEIIRKAFQDFQPGSFPLRNLPEEPQQIFPRYYAEEYPTDLTRVVMAYQGVSLLDKDLYAMDVLGMVLGEGASSRLYLELYKKHRLVEAVAARNNTPLDRGTFDISAVMKQDSVKAFIDKTKEMIHAIQKSGIAPQELAKIKRRVEVERVYDHQTAEGMAHAAAAEEAFTGDCRFSDKYLDGIRRVTVRDIQRVAATYLIDQRLSVVVLKPKAAPSFHSSSGAVTAGVIRKEVFANGLTVLLKEDRTLPLVSVLAGIKAGITQDPPEIEGVSVLTGALWTKGLPGRDADFISRVFEERGAVVSSSAGRNTLTLRMDMLDSDLEFGLGYLEGFLKKPVFPVQEFNRLRLDMLTGLQARKDSITQMTSKKAQQTLFLKHPFSADGRGTEATLNTITREDVLKYYSHFFAPNNMIIGVFGSFDQDKVLKDLRVRFESLPRKDVSWVHSSEEFPTSLREAALSMDKEQAMVMLAFRAPTLEAPDRFAAEVAVNILSSSLGGRMFKRVREELGKAYAVGGVFHPGIDAGMISFYALTNQESAEKVRGILVEESERLASGLVSSKELLDAKASLKGDAASNLQSLSAQVVTSTLDELLGLGYAEHLEYNAHIDAVSAEDVRQLAIQYFNINRAALVVTRPQEPSSK